MNLLFSYLALDLANDRVREANYERLVAIARAEPTDRASVLRRGLAHGLAAISRGSAAATRRLDDCVADDLSRSFAAAK